MNWFDEIKQEIQEIYHNKAHRKITSRMAEEIQRVLDENIEIKERLADLEEEKANEKKANEKKTT